MNDILQSDLFKSASVRHGFLTKIHPVIPAEAGIQCRVKQVHGNNVLQIKDPNTDYKHTQADIIMTDIPRMALTISTADCVPLLFYDSHKKVIAASHAGWRGTAKNVAQTTVMALQKTWGSKPENILSAIGPCIHACCYEVDKPVYDSFLIKNFFKNNPSHANHWMFDLSGMNRTQLLQTGLLDKHIWMSPLCTSCRIDLFHSYRKEKNSGRQYSFIALK